ncbi:MAG: beta-lactamase family protein [Proteobacteria bacterium]|nr:beta-lactamase family protein [Pseudomonadota bacterium]
MILALLACASPFDELDATIEQFLIDEQLEGATAVIVHVDDGVVHKAAYGSFELDRVSMIASSSKVLSAGVLVKLADDGQLDLDAPVSQYLGHWGEHKTDITTAQLLSNSSGMVGLTDDPYYTLGLCQSSRTARCRTVRRPSARPRTTPTVSLQTPSTDMEVAPGSWPAAWPSRSAARAGPSWSRRPTVRVGSRTPRTETTS